MYLNNRFIPQYCYIIVHNTITVISSSLQLLCPKCVQYPIQILIVPASLCPLRATSHTRLKAHDHCILGSLIGQKGRDRLSLLHSGRWRPKGPKKLSWMKSLHDNLFILCHGLLEFLPSPPPRGKGVLLFLEFVWISGMHDWLSKLA